MNPIIDTISLRNQQVDVLRLDKMTPYGIGNKYYKLKYNLAAAKQEGYHTLLSFGGAFSNHIQALAIMGKEAGFQTIGVIRGEDDVHNPTLQFVRKHGMQLHFVDRSAYREKESVEFLAGLKKEYGAFYMLPEGGSNALAVQGSSEILHDVATKYDKIFIACGTGATLAGVVVSAPVSSHVIGISVLKGDDRLSQQVSAYLPPEKEYAQWDISFQYHLGGYAKRNPELSDFIQKIQAETRLETDPVYTSKMAYAAYDMIDKGDIQSDEKVLLIHTGGLQGWDGWRYRFGKD